VSTLNNPLRINVGFLQNQPVGTVRDLHFDLTDFQLSPDFTPLTLKGVIRLDRTPQGIITEADLYATVMATCVRCLEDFQQTLHAQFAELYAYKEDAITEAGLVVPEDGNIDFTPLARDCLLLEIPIKSLCKPDCKGLCMVCGENLNLRTCEHQKQPVES
jgi:uncharacterized protein